MLTKKLQHATVAELAKEWERVAIAILLCPIETEWTKDMRKYRRRIEAELEKCYQKEEAENNG